MKDYNFKHGEVNVEPLKTGLMDLENYKIAHEGMIIPCHDIFIEYDGGILLVKRLNLPAKEILWPLGGRISRGVSIEDSLKEKIWEESHLNLNGLVELGHARTYWKTDPFGHGKGTDTINFVYFGKGEGSLELDSLHEKPKIISTENYQAIRDDLHHYVRDFMDIAITYLELSF